jgi:hypothetical protein
MAARSSLNVLVIAILSVVVLGLIFGLVLQDKTLQEATKTTADAKKKLTAETELLNQTRQELGKLREVITGNIEAIELPVIESYIEQASKYLNLKKSDVPVAGGEKKFGNFRELLAAYESSLARMYQSVEENTKANRESNQLLVQREETHKGQIEGLKKQLTEGEQKLTRALSETADMESAKAELETKLNKQVTEKEDEITQITYRLDRDKTLATQKIAQLSDTITRLKMERIPEKDLAKAPAHGAILRIANKHAAFIDLGRRDFVRPGLVFEVYEQRGATRFRKGMVEINRVDDTWSQVTITQAGSELAPIIAGDKVWSPFFKKDSAPRMAFAGEKLATPLLSLDLMKRKLGEAGVTVTPDVGVDTDYVIAIDGYKDSPSYENARLFGVMILRESEILTYVMQ